MARKILRKKRSLFCWAAGKAWIGGKKTSINPHVERAPDKANVPRLFLSCTPKTAVNLNRSIRDLCRQLAFINRGNAGVIGGQHLDRVGG